MDHAPMGDEAIRPHLLGAGPGFFFAYRARLQYHEPIGNLYVLLASGGMDCPRLQPDHANHLSDGTTWTHTGGGPSWVGGADNFLHASGWAYLGSSGLSRFVAHGGNIWDRINAYFFLPAA